MRNSPPNKKNGAFGGRSRCVLIANQDIPPDPFEFGGIYCVLVMHDHHAAY